jgi:hypothetical protein
MADFPARGLKACRDGIADPSAALARVLTDYNPQILMRLGEMTTQRRSNGIHRRMIERRIARHSTNPIRSKQHSCHENSVPD